MCTNHHIIEHIYCYSITLALHVKISIVKYIIIVLFLNCFSNRCLYNLFYMVLRRVNFKSYCSLEHYSYICPTSARIHKYEFYFLCLILFSYLQNCTWTVPMHTLQLWRKVYIFISVNFYIYFMYSYIFAYICTTPQKVNQLYSERIQTG